MAGMMTLGFGGMWLWLILGLIALWVLAACAVRWMIGPRDYAPSSDPIRILDARLARGEITAEEYRRLHDQLTPGR